MSVWGEDGLRNNEFFRTGAFIHGKWITTGKTFPDTNPATGEKLADVAYSGRGGNGSGHVVTRRKRPSPTGGKPPRPNGPPS